MQIQISLLLDRARADTLTTQLTGQLRDAIRVGRIAPGMRLPSSRRLSEQLGIGRNTVVRAYETLEIECYVESRPASGMFATLPPADPGPVPRFDKPGNRPVPLLPVSAPAAANRGRLSFDFVPGLPNAGLFPLKTWRRLLQTTLSQGGPPGLTHQGDLFGLASLRSAIVSHLGAARGIVADPAQIVIVSGTAEVIAIASRLFLAPGSLVCVEDPCYRPAAAAFQAAGAELCAVPVDDAGIVAADLPPRPTALLYVTPAHQYPTGHTLSSARREQIAAWAQRTGCFILEDDRGADFRYEGGAPRALAAYAPDRTIHLGTFSQSLGAGLRLGYMVVPAPLVETVRTAKSLLNGGAPWLEQAAVAEMLRTGSHTSHVMRMRSAYRERRDHLLEALRRNFGDPDVSGEAGGLHLFWQLPPGVPDAGTVEALGRRTRVGVYSLDSGNVRHSGPCALSRRGLMLGYAALTPKQIDQGIARLSDAVDDALDGHTIGLSDLLLHRPLSPHPAAGLLRRRPVKPAPRNRHQPALSAQPVHRAASGTDMEKGAGRPMAVVTGLYHYPIKGLSPQPLPAVRVEAGKPFPFDRVFALVRPGAPVTTEDPKWAKKGLFVMLMLDERLASVRTHLDAETLQLTVRQGDPQARPLLSVNLDDAAARHDVEAFFHRLAPALRSPPALVRSRDGHFMDKPDNVISLINLATVRSLEQQWGYKIDPLRFRANIYIDGIRPWEEFDWIGADIRLGDALFRVDRRNGRCSATNVDPATGQRDLDIPGCLRKAFGHKDLGIYLLARTDASVAVGDALRLPGGAGAHPSAAPAASLATGRDAFICRGCYFVYDEAQGLPLAGIAPGTRFADLPRTWQCPDCGTDKATFRPHLPTP
ncbi:MAG TPA: aminotransferase class I/II-fold pyridoxal phosphate-dependent enzyme [Rhodopila sp.]|nr:aminotransferase class I/II-fold pyridoxal phosphate-dependent enzyme [Rhodopila sp.]